jgi:hypothetical protein
MNTKNRRQRGQLAQPYRDEFMQSEIPTPKVDFLPGLELSATLFRTAVEPLLAWHAPGMPYAAGLMGAGSEVLGFDTVRSTDHDWGPRLVLFLAPEDLAAWQGRLHELFRHELPRSIAGYSTSFAGSTVEEGISHLAEADAEAPVEHAVTITSVKRWLTEQHGITSLDDLTPATWLTLSEQALLETTSGRIFRDDLGTITTMRETLAWYPDDIWRYRLAAQWQRLDQLEPFVGRCGETGDDLGSQLVAMSLVRDVMKLAFLLERRYAPYPKWFGTGFSRLELAPDLQPHLDAARYATTWPEREAAIYRAQRVLADRHNAMNLSGWVDPEARSFFSRPFQVMFGGRFARALMTSVADSTIRELPPFLGGIDQYIDSTDAMNSHSLHHAIRAWIGDSGR